MREMKKERRMTEREKQESEGRTEEVTKRDRRMAIDIVTYVRGRHSAPEITHHVVDRALSKLGND